MMSMDFDKLLEDMKDEQKAKELTDALLADGLPRYGASWEGNEVILKFENGSVIKCVFKDGVFVEVLNAL